MLLGSVRRHDRTKYSESLPHSDGLYEYYRSKYGVLIPRTLSTERQSLAPTPHRDEVCKPRSRFHALIFLRGTRLLPPANEQNLRESEKTELLILNPRGEVMLHPVITSAEGTNAVRSLMLVLPTNLRCVRHSLKSWFRQH